MKPSAYYAAIAATAALSLAADNLTPNIRPLEAQAGPKPFTYLEAPDKLPNYLAGERWGTQGQPITQMQSPLSPEASAGRYVTQPGFGVKLFAAEPDITKPIALAWDERGRLWIAETVDYPNEQQPDGQGRDRIKICEDTDNDGRADKFTVFADKISVPTSLCFANGGLLVIEGGHTLLLKDTNGDDVADERRVLFSGWGMNDTHATASNLRYGHDNWIWGTVGYSGFNGEVGGQRLRFGQGVFRFKPDGSALEFVRSSNNNTWGLGLTEDGVVLGSTANGNAAWYMAIPNRFYEAVRGWSASRMESVADSQAIYPVTDKVRQVDWHHKYTAGAGSALYTARAFPREFWNRISFVCEPTGHLIGWFRWEREGADFKAVNLGSFLASDDEWSSPIVAEVGPEGALWVIDWYNYIIQHNPVPRGFKNGRGNAYETTLRDKKHGRIYRVVAQDAPAQAAALDRNSPRGLVAALKSDNQLWRMHAQRLLVERGNRDVVPALTELVRDPAVDPLGYNLAAVHALHTLHGLGALDGSGVVAEALKHPSAAVRRAAVTVAPRTADSARQLRAGGTLLNDPDAQVRLAALLALAEMPAHADHGASLVNALKDERNAGDRWLREAAISAAARNDEPFLSALAGESGALAPAALDAVRTVARHYAAGAPEPLRLLPQLARAHAANSAAILDGLADGWPADQKPEFTAPQHAALADAFKALPEPARIGLVMLVRRWGALDRFPEQLGAATAGLRARIADDSATDGVRASAARNLLQLADTSEHARAVLAQVNAQASPELGGGLIESLNESRADETGAALLENWKRFTPAQRRAAIGLLLRRSEWSGLLLDAIERGDLRSTELGQQQWGQLRRRGGELARRAEKLAAGGPVASDREAVLKQFLPAAEKSGDVARGKELYAANCAVCHKLEGLGQSIGPDLTGVGARPKAEILQEILDPNRSVESNYVLWTAETRAGDIFAGRLDTETQTSIELTDLTGKKHAIQRRDIASLEASTQSIMPTGLEQMGEQGLADLLAFLATSREGSAAR